MRARGRRCPRAGEGRLGSGLPLLLKNSGGTAQVTPTDPDSHVASGSAGEKHLGSPCTDGGHGGPGGAGIWGSPCVPAAGPAREAVTITTPRACRPTFPSPGRLLCARLQARGAGRGADADSPSGPRLRRQQSESATPPPPAQTTHVPQGADPELAEGRPCNSPIGGSTGIPIFQAHGD